MYRNSIFNTGSLPCPHGYKIDKKSGITSKGIGGNVMKKGMDNKHVEKHNGKKHWKSKSSAQDVSMNFNKSGVSCDKKTDSNNHSFIDDLNQANHFKRPKTHKVKNKLTQAGIVLANEKTTQAEDKRKTDENHSTPKNCKENIKESNRENCYNPLMNSLF